MHAAYAGLEGLVSRKVPLVSSPKLTYLWGISHAFWKITKDRLLVYLSAELALSRPTDLSVKQPPVWSFGRYVVGKRGSSRMPGSYEVYLPRIIKERGRTNPLFCACASGPGIIIGSLALKA